VVLTWRRAVTIASATDPLDISHAVPDELWLSVLVDAIDENVAIARGVAAKTESEEERRSILFPVAGGADETLASGATVAALPAARIAALRGAVIRAPQRDLVAWPAALRAAQAEGYTHFRLRAVNRGDGLMVESNRPFAPISEALTLVAEDPRSFEQRSERLELPTIDTMMLDGPFAGMVVASYEFIHRPSVWDRVRAPEI
jgi:hypothetical protein